MKGWKDERWKAEWNDLKKNMLDDEKVNKGWIGEKVNKGWKYERMKG